MPLIQLINSSPEIIFGYNIKQIVSTAGNGILSDDSECSSELLYFLKSISADRLYEHIQYCLNNSFEKSGYVLQDIVNELGRRLDYEVENGLYQGTKNEIGFDGIWRASDGHSIIVETKTTDAYRIRLNNLAKYREKLIQSEKITTNSSILIVVGRDDTGDLEEQIRGSRYAWDVRIISAESLMKLVNLKINSDEDETTEKIKSLLIPIEYTRLDNIIDIIFTTAKDVVTNEEKQPVYLTSDQKCERLEYKQDRSSNDMLDEVRENAITAFVKKNGENLIAHKRTQYWNTDKRIRVVTIASKKYENGGYWYGFHPRQEKFLSEGEQGFLILCCLNNPYSYAIPLNEMKKIMPDLHVTDRENRFYWHVRLELNSHGNYELIVPNKKNLSLESYKLNI